MVAMDDSASMLCARVMRGISSMENAVTPVAASSWIVSSCPSGRTNPTRIWPARSSGRSAWPVRSLEPWHSTWTTTSARRKTSARAAASWAPLAAYSVSRYPAANPAPASMATWKPAFVRLGMTAGPNAPLAGEGLPGNTDNHTHYGTREAGDGSCRGFSCRLLQRMGAWNHYFEERVAHGYIGSTWSTFWQADSCPTNL